MKHVLSSMAAHVRLEFVSCVQIRDAAVTENPSETEGVTADDGSRDDPPPLWQVLSQLRPALVVSGVVLNWGWEWSWVEIGIAHMNI